jgi:glutamate decarboxylase
MYLVQASPFHLFTHSLYFVYTLAPPNAELIKLLRVVVREDFSKSRCDLLIRDILAVIKQLDAQDAKTIQETR